MFYPVLVSREEAVAAAVRSGFRVDGGVYIRPRLPKPDHPVIPETTTPYAVGKLFMYSGKLSLTQAIVEERALPYEWLPSPGRTELDKSRGDLLYNLRQLGVISGEHI